MHDAAHGSVANADFTFLNSCIGYLSALCFPTPFTAFKQLHLVHHKLTNEPDDPDVYTGTGPKHLLIFRWMTIEWRYYVLYLPNIAERPIAESVSAILSLIVYILILATLSTYGFGHCVLWGWIIPGRLAITMLAYFFDYLPHRSEITRAQDAVKATSVTSLYGYGGFKDSDPESVASSWYLTWPLFHQNYHNIHHLAPYVPFYKYSTLWHSLRDKLLAQGTEIKPIFTFAHKKSK
jgi:fatty acid desaturase